MAFGFEKKYSESSDVKNKRQQLKNIAADKPEYNNTYENQLSAVYDRIKNQKGFSYDAGNDSAYQQMAANYRALSGLGIAGNQAAVNGLSGGYGTSYGSIASNQAQSLADDKAQDKQADYYLAAQDLYDAENQRLSNTYNAVSVNRDSALSDYSRALGAYNDAVGYSAEAYADARDNDYTRYQDNREYLWQQYWNDAEQANTEKELAEKQKQYNRSLNEDYWSYLNQLSRSESPADGKESFDSRDETDKKYILYKINSNRGEEGQLNSLVEFYNNKNISKSEFVYLAQSIGLSDDEIKELLDEDKE